MKKVISVIIVLICVLMIGSSFADTKHWVFDGAYDFWKDLNKDFIDICNETLCMMVAITQSIIT